MKKYIIILIIIFIIFGTSLIYRLNAKNYSISDLTEFDGECIKKGNKCDNGTLINIKVNENKSYNFYVINDNNKILTLITSENIGNNTNWTLNNTTCEKGPDNLINYIKDLTKEWKSIEEKEYIFSDRNKCYEEKREKIKGRIPTYNELKKLGCKYFFKESCPKYLYENLANNSLGYWLSTTRKPLNNESAYVVSRTGDFAETKINVSEYYGLRLVIEIEK